MKNLLRATGFGTILLGVSSLLLIGSRAASEPAFSRSRWILEQEAWGARFSGGVLPAERSGIEALLDVLAAPEPARAARPRSFRVSFDILDGGAAPAQMETQAEPYVDVNPEREGHLLAGYQEGRFANGGARALTYAVSFDSGRTWREGLVPRLSHASGGPFERASDPWVAFGPGGRAYFVSLAFNQSDPANGVFVSGSDDGGLTWRDPVAVHTASRDFDDKEAMAVDTLADSPFLGRIYVGWDIVTADRRQLLVVSHSADGGLSFRPPVTLDAEGSNLGAFPIVAPGGIVHVVWTSLDSNGSFLITSLLTSRSEDGGDTWSAPVVISDHRSFGVPGARTGDGLPSAAVDRRNGNLYVVWQDSRFSPGVDQVVLSRSTDGGRTWSEPQLVSDGPRNAANFTPAVAVSGNGRVGVAFYSLRNDPARRVLVDEYLAVSRDGGRRFARSIRVSSTSWDLRFAAFSRGFFLGDYQGLAAGRQMFHPLWIGTFNASRLDPGSRQPDAFTRPLQAR